MTQTSLDHINSVLKKTTAAALVFFFTINTCFADAGMRIDLSPRAETPKLMQIDIPAELASVEDFYEAPARPNPKMILHIQNAHTNYEAQQKIRDLMVYLNKNYGFKTIFVEGASENLNPEYLKLFPDAETNKKLWDELAKRGQITGADWFLLEGSERGLSQAACGTDPNGSLVPQGTVPMQGQSPTDEIKGVGIEKADLYRKNYEALKAVYSRDTETKRFLNGLDSELDKLASKMLPPQKRNILSEWKKFEKGHREFIPFVSSLAKLAKENLDLDLHSLMSQIEWPQLTRLLVLQSMEEKLKQPRAQSLKLKGQNHSPKPSDLDEQKITAKQAAEIERKQIIEWMKKKGVRNELIQKLELFDEQHINLNTIKASSGKTESLPRFFIEKLVEEAGPKGLKFSDYPNFALQAGYLILRYEVEPNSLFAEIRKLFDKLLDQNEHNPVHIGCVQGCAHPMWTGSELIALFRDAELVRKLLNLELSRDEWQKVISQKDQLEPQKFFERVKSLSGQSLKVKSQNHNSKADSLSEQGTKNKEQSSVIPAQAGIQTPYQKQVQTAFDSAFSFYGFATRREEVFFQKIEAELAHTDKAIVMTGGFHTDGLKTLFREHDISYGTLTPRLTQVENSNLYREVMLGHSSASEASLASGISSNSSRDTLHDVRDTGSPSPTVEIITRSESRAAQEAQGANEALIRGGIENALLGIEGMSRAKAEGAAKEYMDKITRSESRDQKIAEIEPNESPMDGVVYAENEWDALVDEPLLESVKILFRKNIETTNTSANRKDIQGRDPDLPPHALIRFNKETLSEKNREILMNFNSAAPAWSYGRVQVRETYLGIDLMIPISAETRVGELSDFASVLAEQFELQELHWNRYTLEDLRSKYLSQEASIAYFEQSGWVYDAVTEFFYGSEEQKANAKRWESVHSKIRSEMRKQELLDEIRSHFGQTPFLKIISGNNFDQKVLNAAFFMMETSLNPTQWRRAWVSVNTDPRAILFGKASRVPDEVEQFINKSSRKEEKEYHLIDLLGRYLANILVEKNNAFISDKAWVPPVLPEVNMVTNGYLDLASGVVVSDFIYSLPPNRKVVFNDSNHFIAGLLKETAAISEMKNVEIEERDLLDVVRDPSPYEVIRLKNVWYYEPRISPKVTSADVAVEFWRNLASKILPEGRLIIEFADTHESDTAFAPIYHQYLAPLLRQGWKIWQNSEPDPQSHLGGKIRRMIFTKPRSESRNFGGQLPAISSQLKSPTTARKPLIADVVRSESRRLITADDLITRLTESRVFILAHESEGKKNGAEWRDATEYDVKFGVESWLDKGVGDEVFRNAAAKLRVHYFLDSQKYFDSDQPVWRMEFKARSESRADEKANNFLESLRTFISMYERQLKALPGFGADPDINKIHREVKGGLLSELLKNSKFENDVDRAAAIYAHRAEISEILRAWPSIEAIDPDVNFTIAVEALSRPLADGHWPFLGMPESLDSGVYVFSDGSRIQKDDKDAYAKATPAQLAGIGRYELQHPEGRSEMRKEVGLRARSESRRELKTDTFDYGREQWRVAEQALIELINTGKYRDAYAQFEELDRKFSLATSEFVLGAQRDLRRLETVSETPKAAGQISKLKTDVIRRIIRLNPYREPKSAEDGDTGRSEFRINITGVKHYMALVEAEAVAAARLDPEKWTNLSGIEIQKHLYAEALSAGLLLADVASSKNEPAVEAKQPPENVTAAYAAVLDVHVRWVNQKLKSYFKGAANKIDISQIGVWRSLDDINGDYDIRNGEIRIREEVMLTRDAKKVRSVLLHEALHHSFDYYNSTINEAMTEFFTKEIMGTDYVHSSKYMDYYAALEIFLGAQEGGDVVLEALKQSYLKKTMVPLFEALQVFSADEHEQLTLMLILNEFDWFQHEGHFVDGYVVPVIMKYLFYSFEATLKYNQKARENFSHGLPFETGQEKLLADLTALRKQVDLTKDKALYLEKDYENPGFENFLDTFALAHNLSKLFEAHADLTPPAGTAFGDARLETLGSRALGLGPEMARSEMRKQGESIEKVSSAEKLKWPEPLVFDFEPGSKERQLKLSAFLKKQGFPTLAALLKRFEVPAGTPEGVNPEIMLEFHLDDRTKSELRLKSMLKNFKNVKTLKNWDSYIEARRARRRSDGTEVKNGLPQLVQVNQIVIRLQKPQSLKNIKSAERIFQRVPGSKPVVMSLKDFLSKGGKLNDEGRDELRSIGVAANLKEPGNHRSENRSISIPTALAFVVIGVAGVASALAAVFAAFPWITTLGVLTGILGLLRAGKFFVDRRLAASGQGAPNSLFQLMLAVFQTGLAPLRFAMPAGRQESRKIESPEAEDRRLESVGEFNSLESKVARSEMRQNPISLQNLFNVLFTKLGVREMMKGAPIEGVKFFAGIQAPQQLAKRESDVFKVLKRQLIPGENLLNFKSLAREIVSGNRKLPLVFKPNGGAGGEGIFFIEREDADHLKVSMAYQPEKDVSRRIDWATIIPQAIEKIPGVAVTRLPDQGLLEIKIETHSYENAANALYTIWEKISSSLNDAGMIEEMLDLFKVEKEGRPRSLETRYFISLNPHNGEIEIKTGVPSDLIQDFSFTRIGGNAMFANRKGNEVRGAEKTYDVYAPFGMQAEEVNIFKQKVNSDIKLLTDYILLRLKKIVGEENIHQLPQDARLRVTLDVFWMKPDAVTLGFPRLAPNEIQIESNLALSDYLNAKPLKFNPVPLIPSVKRSEMRTLADLLSQRLSAGAELEFIDLDTGAGAFPPEFEKYLRDRGYKVKGWKATEPYPDEATPINENVRKRIIKANAQFESEFLELKKHPVEIVTINNIETAPGELANRALELLKNPGGILLVTVESNDVIDSRQNGIMAAIQNAGFDVSIQDLPADYPEYSSFVKASKLIIAVPKTARSLPRRQAGEMRTIVIDGPSAPLTSEFYVDGDIWDKLAVDQDRIMYILKQGGNFSNGRAHTVGDWDDHRTVILPLIRPVEIEGRKYESAKIIGVLISADKDIPPLDFRANSQSEVLLAPRDGVIHWIDIPPHPAGSSEAIYAESRFHGAKLAQKNKLLVAPPVGFGKFTNKNFSYRDKSGTHTIEVGYFIELLEGQDETSLYSMVAEKAAETKDSIELTDWLSLRLGEYAGSLRDLNAFAKHGQPTNNNFVYENGRPRLKDYEGTTALSELSPDDRLAYLIKNFESLIFSIMIFQKMLENPYDSPKFGSVESGRRLELKEMLGKKFPEIFSSYFRNADVGNFSGHYFSWAGLPQLYMDLNQTILKEGNDLKSSRHEIVELFRREFDAELAAPTQPAVRRSEIRNRRGFLGQIVTAGTIALAGPLEAIAKLTTPELKMAPANMLDPAKLKKIKSPNVLKILNEAPEVVPKQIVRLTKDQEAQQKETNRFSPAEARKILNEILDPIFNEMNIAEEEKENKRESLIRLGQIIVANESGYWLKNQRIKNFIEQFIAVGWGQIETGKEGSRVGQDHLFTWFYYNNFKGSDIRSTVLNHLHSEIAEGLGLKADEIKELVDTLKAQAPNNETKAMDIIGPWLAKKILNNEKLDLTFMMTLVFRQIWKNSKDDASFLANIPDLVGDEKDPLNAAKIEARALNFYANHYRIKIIRAPKNETPEAATKREKAQAKIDADNSKKTRVAVAMLRRSNFSKTAESKLFVAAEVFPEPQAAEPVLAKTLFEEFSRLPLILAGIAAVVVALSGREKRSIQRGKSAGIAFILSMSASVFILMGLAVTAIWQSDQPIDLTPLYFNAIISMSLLAGFLGFKKLSRFQSKSRSEMRDVKEQKKAELGKRIDAFASVLNEQINSKLPDGWGALEDQLNELAKLAKEINPEPINYGQAVVQEEAYFARTPLRTVAAILNELQLSAEDTIYDLGSGDGRVVWLSGLLTQAGAAKGVERDDALFELSKKIIEALKKIAEEKRIHLKEMAIWKGDFQDIDEATTQRPNPFKDGTVFYVFRPNMDRSFGVMMRQLRATGAERVIRVVAVGVFEDELGENFTVEKKIGQNIIILRSTSAAESSKVDDGQQNRSENRIATAEDRAKSRGNPKVAVRSEIRSDALDNLKSFLIQVVNNHYDVARHLEKNSPVYQVLMMIVKSRLAHLVFSIEMTTEEKIVGFKTLGNEFEALSDKIMQLGVQSGAGQIYEEFLIELGEHIAKISALEPDKEMVQKPDEAKSPRNRIMVVDDKQQNGEVVADILRMIVGDDHVTLIVGQDAAEQADKHLQKRFQEYSLIVTDKDMPPGGGENVGEGEEGWALIEKWMKMDEKLSFILNTGDLTDEIKAKAGALGIIGAFGKGMKMFEFLENAVQVAKEKANRSELRSQISGIEKIQLGFNPDALKRSEARGIFKLIPVLLAWGIFNFGSKEANADTLKARQAIQISTIDEYAQIVALRSENGNVIDAIRRSDIASEEHANTALILDKLPTEEEFLRDVVPVLEAKPNHKILILAAANQNWKMSESSKKYSGRIKFEILGSADKAQRVLKDAAARFFGGAEYGLVGSEDKLNIFPADFFDKSNVKGVSTFDRADLDSVAPDKRALVLNLQATKFSEFSGSRQLEGFEENKPIGTIKRYKMTRAGFLGMAGKILQILQTLQIVSSAA